MRRTTWLPITTGLLGGVLGWAIARSTATPAPIEVDIPTCTPPELQADAHSLQPLAAQERALSMPPITSVTATPHEIQPASQVEQLMPPESDASAWRISAIEKFVPLSDDQKERLRRAYARQADDTENDGAPPESLDDILGVENAEVYREQVRQAFTKMQEEEVDKEVVWLSRQLNLSSEVETALRRVYGDVETQLKEERREQRQPEVARSRQQRAQEIVDENRRRQQLLLERLKGVLSPDQYQGYARIQSESAGADMEVFHGR